MIIESTFAGSAVLYFKKGQKRLLDTKKGKSPGHIENEAGGRAISRQAHRNSYPVLRDISHLFEWVRKACLTSSSRASCNAASDRMTCTQSTFRIFSYPPRQTAERRTRLLTRGTPTNIVLFSADSRINAALFAATATLSGEPVPPLLLVTKR
jgi:hypothetical protein